MEQVENIFKDIKWEPNSFTIKINFDKNINDNYSLVHIVKTIFDWEWNFLSRWSHADKLKKWENWFWLYNLFDWLLWTINTKEELLDLLKQKYNYEEYIWEDELDNFLKF